MRTILGATWRELPADPGACAELSQALALSPIIARVLVARGVTTPPQAQVYLKGGLEDLHDPFLMRDMQQAVAAIRRALDTRARIRIYGDYDADGVTATALLVRALRALGAEVDYYLPHRIDEGYGLNIAAVEQAARDGVGLLVTVDCGVTADAALGRARELGLPVIVTDHHEPRPSLPPAAAILDPKRADCPYPFKDLSGVGVAYKLLSALAADLGLRAGAERSFLDLVAIGTIADVVALTGENRLLVKHGLAAIAHTRKQGITALLRAAAIAPPVTSYNVAFGLAPRLNAAGRLDHARAAVALLLSGDPGEAQRLAARLCALNNQRQEQERRAFDAAVEMIRRAHDLRRERLLLLVRDDWHPGVIGVVASRLVERYRHPVVLVALDDGIARGSARSIPGFHIHDALCRCATRLEEFGGHALAAGFTIAPDNLDSLRAELTALAAESLRPEDLVPRIDLDAWSDLRDLTIEAAQGMAALAPFGSGNPRPLIGVRNLVVETADTCGAEGQHLRLTVRSGASSGADADCAVRAIWFGYGRLAPHLTPGTALDLCGLPEVDEWNGVRSVRLRVHDLAMENPPPSAAHPVS